MKKIFFSFSFFISFWVSGQKYIPVDAGSKMHFVIKNLGINTGGDFTGLTGEIIFDAKNTSKCFFDVTVDVKTIDTDLKKRDEHLKKEEYFHAEKYPLIRLVSTKIEPGTNLKNFIFVGNLTLKNTTKVVRFPFTAEGKTGGALFIGSFEIDRTAFGVGKESFSLSNKVKVTLSAFAKAQ